MAMVNDGGLVSVNGSVFKENKVNMEKRESVIRSRWEKLNNAVLDVFDICNEEGEDALPFIIKATKGASECKMEVDMKMPSLEDEVEVTEGLRDQAKRLGIGLFWTEADGASEDMELFGTEKTGAELCRQIWIAEREKKSDEDIKRGLLNCALGIVLGGNEEHMEFLGLEPGDVDIIRDMLNNLGDWDQQRYNEDYFLDAAAEVSISDTIATCDGWRD